MARSCMIIYKHSSRREKLPKHNHSHSKKQKAVNLALQGGGAHGAFTWGVLDKLLEDGRIGIDGI